MTLRPLARDDVETVAAIQREPEITRWWGAPDLDKLVAKAEGTEGVDAFAIEHEGEVVGLIQCYEEDDDDFRHAGVDVFVTMRHHGGGLGTDAVRTLARHLLSDRGHHRLVIDPAAANVAAIRAYAKVGFRPVGVMRRYWRGPDGEWHDGLLMDLLADELV